MNLYKTIVSEIIKAQYASDAAKQINYLRSYYYSLKDMHIKNAINLLNYNKYVGITYKKVMALDQNGHDSIVIYFEVDYKGRKHQVSFHNFSLKRNNKGHSEIEWTKDVGGSKNSSDYLNKNLKLNITEYGIREL